MLPIRQAASNSRAVTGDVNAQTATIVPTLSEAADSQNLVVSADTSVLNKNQVLKLDDTFYETITNEVWPQQLQDGKVAIAGTTMGWMDTQKCFIEIPFTTQFATSGTVATDMVTPDGNGERPPSAYDWNDFAQPEFHMLRPIRRFQVFLGENNVSIQRAQMNFRENFPVIIYDKKYHRNDYPMLSSLGFPISIGSHALQVPAGGNATQINNRISTLNPEFCNARRLAFMSMNRIRRNGGVSYLVVPLYCLNSFFRENQYLPPGLKFRFEMEYTTGSVEIQRTSVTSTTQGVNSWGITYNNQIRFNAFAYILRAGTQEQINRNWITNPFLYNYTTYEYLERKTNGSSLTYYENICISQQRPTDIIIRVLNEGTNGLLANIAGGNLYSYNLAGVPGVCIHDIKINIAGRLQYHFRNADLITDQNQQWAGGQMDMVDALMNTANNDTWRNVNEEEYLVQPQTRTLSESGYCVISIQPGNMQSIGNYSTDQGAVSVQIELNICMNDKQRSPLPSTFKIVIYKKLTEQIAIDANKNVQIIQWPAVKSNSGYVVQQTFNMN